MHDPNLRGLPFTQKSCDDETMKRRHLTNQPLLFSIMVVMFFIWGFITLMNDLLIPNLKQSFDLNYAQALLIQFCFFTTYFIMSVPMSRILNRLAYKKSLLLGLLIIIIGCLLFIPATHLRIYALFLFGLFILASGIVMLQVAANPLVTILGDHTTSPARLTLAQGVNSLGYVLAPFLVGGFIAKSSISQTYIIIAIILVLVIIVLSFFKFEVTRKMQDEIAEMNAFDGPHHLWHHWPFVFGVFAIFVYVGAEVTGGSLVINFLHLPNIANMPIATATDYLSIFWGGAMIGRLLGSYILMKIEPPLVLMFNAAANFLLVMVIVFTTGWLAMWALLLLGIFNSIMFPTIFALAIERLPTQAIKNKASGYLVMAIVGGAVIPEIQGMIADHIGLQHSFFLLLICYVLIASFAWYMLKLTKNIFSVRD